jgi:ribosomal protein S18 acetylase RimI-like enzyme
VPLRRASSHDIPAIVALTEAAYLPNESIIGVPSLPRIADYRQVLAEHEVWLAESDGALDAVLVLEEEPAKFTLWSIAVAPAATGKKLGSMLMDFTEERARALGHDAVHLYTHARLSDRIGWYERLGYQITHYEDLPDRRLVHMRKSLQESAK